MERPIAPMELDPEGIRRAIRWTGESPLPPDWNRVIAFLGRWMDRELAVRRLHALADRVRELPRTAKAFQRPDPVFEHCQPRWTRLADALEQTA